MPTPKIDTRVRFTSDTTLRWSCRKGDIIVWFTWSSIMAAPKDGLRIADFWKMEDGNFLTITNRPADIPPWFSFHPTEVCNNLALHMTEKIKKGDYPEYPIEVPNIWKPRAGER